MYSRVVVLHTLMWVNFSHKFHSILLLLLAVVTWWICKWRIFTRHNNSKKFVALENWRACTRSFTSKVRNEINKCVDVVLFDGGWLVMYTGGRLLCTQRLVCRFCMCWVGNNNNIIIISAAAAVSLPFSGLLCTVAWVYKPSEHWGSRRKAVSKYWYGTLDIIFNWKQLWRYYHLRRRVLSHQQQRVMSHSTSVPLCGNLEEIVVYKLR